MASAAVVRDQSWQLKLTATGFLRAASSAAGGASEGWTEREFAGLAIRGEEVFSH